MMPDRRFRPCRKGPQLKRWLPNLLETAIGPLRFSSLRILCALWVSVAIPLLSSAQQLELNVAAAADLKFAMTDLAAAYEKKTGVKLNLVFGSSGNFLAQIHNGAPYDLFFSADELSPRKLSEAGIHLYGTFQEYAIGRIVLWSPADAKVDPSESGWRSLLDPSVQKIAIANPDHAPYGRAALEALKNSGYYDQVKDKLVFGENIAQAAQFVQSGNAQIGILAQALVLAPDFGRGHFWEIPLQHYTPLHQYVVALKNPGREDPAKEKEALAFVGYVLSHPGRAILAKYGLLPKPSNSDMAR